MPLDDSKGRRREGEMSSGGERWSDRTTCEHSSASHVADPNTSTVPRVPITSRWQCGPARLRLAEANCSSAAENSLLMSYVGTRTQVYSDIIILLVVIRTHQIWGHSPMPPGPQLAPAYAIRPVLFAYERPVNHCKFLIDPLKWLIFHDLFERVRLRTTVPQSGASAACGQLVASVSRLCWELVVSRTPLSPSSSHSSHVERKRIAVTSGGELQPTLRCFSRRAF